MPFPLINPFLTFALKTSQSYSALTDGIMRERQIEREKTSVTKAVEKLKAEIEQSPEHTIVGQGLMNENFRKLAKVISEKQESLKAPLGKYGRMLLALKADVLAVLTLGAILKIL